MKNKYINIILSLLVAPVLFVGCTKDYLEKEPTQFISADRISKVTDIKPDIQASNVRGIYTMMYTPGTGGTTSHDDFGQKGYDIFSDLLSSDMVLGGLNYGWYSSIARLTATNDYTNNANYKVWRYYYRVINAANQVIEGFADKNVTELSDKAKEFYGQAKVMRAYGYFYLANFFASDYNPSESILPIYTDTKSPNQPLSTTQEVYDLIVKDLTESIELLANFQRAGKQEVNKYVAEGLLAYVYSVTGKYQEAASLADDVIANGGFTLMTKDEVVGGFNNVNTSGWIWGVDLTLDIGLDLISWWGQVDLYTYSYAWAGDTKIIDWGLYNQIQNTDIRKTQFYPKPSKAMPYKKFYAPNRKIGGQRKITTDYVYMRLAEMYLLKAENLAKSGDDSGAKLALKGLLEQRLDDVSYLDALSDQALQDEIYLQTRIELWGEGKTYLAMKRNKKTVTRGENHLVKAGESFKYNDRGMYFLIPQSEVQNNPNISQ